MGIIVPTFTANCDCRYQENPTVISIERDRYSWNTSFPAATICPTYKMNSELVEDYVAESSTRNKTLLREFIYTLANATYGTFDKVRHAG